MSAYHKLIDNLDGFIRKYYLNKLIKGGLFFAAAVIPVYLLVSLLEYNFYFDSPVRYVLLLSLLVFACFGLINWIVIPLLKYFQLGKRLSHEQAAIIIGDHFQDVSDKLLNILQLKEQASSSSGSDLLLASIEQKSNEIKLISFPKAIDLNRNRKYLKWALPPLFLLITLLFIEPALIADSTNRLVNPGKVFEKPQPFKFLLLNETLEVVQFEDYLLEIQVLGSILPAEVFLFMDGHEYTMERISNDKFAYTLRNVQKDKTIQFKSAEVESNLYDLAVLMRPSVDDFNVQLDYPAYTQRKPEALQAVGDLFVPAGTAITWEIDVKNSDEVFFSFGDGLPTAAERKSTAYFLHKERPKKSADYKIHLYNAAYGLKDSLVYSINVIPDLYPEIELEVFTDSTDSRQQFFVGSGSDDYGISKLEFVYQILDKAGEERFSNRELIVGKSGRALSYDYSWNIRNLELLPGDQVVYYFEIWDNDRVNGSKAARTTNMVFKTPTLKELEEQTDEGEELIKDKLEQAIKDSKRVKEQAKKLREDLLQKKEADWQDKKELEKLLEEQKNIQQQIEDAKDAFDENLDKQEDYNEPSEDIQEKQEQLEDMFEELLDEDMQKLMEDIQELMEQLDKDMALEKLEEFENNDENQEMEMERLLELFKQLELEYEVEKAIDKLEELAEQEEALSKKSAEETMSNEELQAEQEAIQEAFEELEKELENIQKQNEELEKPMDMDDLSEDNEAIKDDMQKSQQDLSQQKNDAASKKQKQAADKMKEKAQSMSMSMQSQQMSQMSEDMNALRQLLENIVGLSFQQEDIMDLFQETTINTPKYVELVQDQFKLENDFQMIEDSLFSLSKRLFQIETFIVEKIGLINTNIEGSIDLLEERKVSEASVSQQTVMKNLNDLAVMLSEVMNQMQKDMSSMMPGAQMCDNPGGQGPKPSDKISEGQEGLNKEMKQGQGKQGKGESLNAKDFAEMAARQAALRKALEAKRKKLAEQGKPSPELQEIIDQMNEQEKQLVNKQLTNQMMKRQQEILNRLLEHEKAEREQEFDEQRKSQTAQQIEKRVPPALEEYLKARENSLNLYKSSAPNLKPFYRNLTDEYVKEKGAPLKE